MDAVGNWDFDPSLMDEQSDVEKSAKVSDYLKLAEGINNIRVLPKVGGGNPFVQRFKHRMTVPGKQFDMQYECLRMASGGTEACPGCEIVDRLRKSGNEIDKDKAFKLSARVSYLVNAVHMGLASQGPKVWEVNSKLFDWLKKLLKDTENGGNFTHPETGFSIVIEREGTGQMDTKYTQRPGRPSKIANPEWIELQHNLDGFLTRKTYHEIKYALQNKGEWPKPEELRDYLADLGVEPGTTTGNKALPAPKPLGAAQQRQAQVAATPQTKAPTKGTLQREQVNTVVDGSFADVEDGTPAATDEGEDIPF